MVFDKRIRMKKLFFLFFAFFLNSQASAISVKVQLHYENKNFLKNIDVCFWEKKAFIFKENPSYCTKSNEVGVAEIDIPEGEYYVFSEKKMVDKYLFGFLGLNPLKATKNMVLNVNLIDYPTNFMKKIKDSAIRGRVFYKGKPVNDADVFLYVDLSTELKGPPFLSTKTDINGNFRIILEEGSYYLFVKKKKEYFGPPKAGDLVSFFPLFPVIIKEKGGYEVHVEMMKVSERITESLNKLIKVYGTVKDKNNSAIEGVYVVAYDQPEILGKPKYISSPSDKRGKFTIYLKDAGKYHIVVRKTLGDTPDIGDIFVYGEVNIVEDNENEIEIITDFNS